jgi:hypothetical protein
MATGRAKLGRMGRGGAERDGGRGPGRPRKWSERTILAELRQFVGDRQTFPTRREFEAAGRRDLWNAIRARGGSRVWAARVELPLREAQRREALSDREAIVQAKEVTRREGYLPGASKLRDLGYPKLATYIYFAGGAKRFAREHRLWE